MRVVLDTNILVSALIAPAGNPAAIYNAWEQGKFTLLTCVAGNADYLVTGDKSGLLPLASHKSTRIVTARDFAALFAEPAS